VVERVELKPEEVGGEEKKIETFASKAYVESAKGLCKFGAVFFPKVWDLICRFKEYCRPKGWNVYENEDLIEVENQYHGLIWVSRLHPSTFKSVVTKPLCPIQEGISYRTVRLAYMAWVLPQTPSTIIWELVKEAPSLSRRIALYDLSQIYRGKSTCLKMNKTRSIVLQEFERFLNEKYGVNLV